MKMKIKFFYTNQLFETDWISYTNSFNQVFTRNFSIINFKEKYTNTCYGYSFHGFILDEDNNIVGGCSAMPYKYNYFGSERVFVLFVDAFVQNEYRKNEFALFDAYSIVKEELKRREIPMIISVPNDIAYLFWKKLARWKDIGILPWYVMPIKLGNLMKKNKIFNISYIFVWLWALTNLIFSFFLKRKAPSSISLSVSKNFKEKRLRNYSSIKDTPFHYSIVSEDGIKALYLLNDDCFNARQLSRAVWHIINKESKNIDIVIYVGNINILQLSLIKFPMEKLPRKFLFCGGIIDKKVLDDRVFDYSYWDFSLINFDVR